MVELMVESDACFCAFTAFTECRAMCRLVGIVASEVTEFGLVLKEAPRSLARLSHQHPDGWGVAAHGTGTTESSPPSSEAWMVRGAQQDTWREGEWRVHKGTERAADCRRFQKIASRSAGTVLIAHVRQKTVGSTRLENTHPFMQSGWVFAHNGTIDDQAFVRANTSAARLAEVRGDTDSELLFAYLLTQLDTVGLARVGPTPCARDEATRVLADATEALRARKVGAFNFLLSDGASCFVHRFGRTLFLLERTPNDPSMIRPAVPNPTTNVTKWLPRRQAVLVASEKLTDEPWRELAEGTLLRIDRSPVPTIAWSASPERVAS
jgi:predicted glutamine amidotransferase